MLPIAAWKVECKRGTPISMLLGVPDLMFSMALISDYSTLILLKEETSSLA